MGNWVANHCQKGGGTFVGRRMFSFSFPGSIFFEVGFSVGTRIESEFAGDANLA